MIQPVIGIICGVGLDWKPDAAAYLSYSRAIESAGAKVALLGTGRHGKLSECDGLLITGGRDVHPRLYDRLPGDESLSDDEVCAKYKIKTEMMRDEVDFRLVQEALAAGKPCLGICRGFQVLNIVVGRLLIPDILTYMPGALTHFADENGLSEWHEIAIEPNSWIKRCYGSGPITVNSRHHQGIASEFVSDQFRVTAIAPDGIVEAVEMKDARFVVGVGWHPEKESDEYIHQISGPLFQAFVDASLPR